MWPTQWYHESGRFYAFRPLPWMEFFIVAEVENGTMIAPYVSRN